MSDENGMNRDGIICFEEASFWEHVEDTMFAKSGVQSGIWIFIDTYDTQLCCPSMKTITALNMTTFDS